MRGLNPGQAPVLAPTMGSTVDDRHTLYQLSILSGVVPVEREISQMQTSL